MPCIIGQAWASSDTKGRRATINLIGYCFCTYVTAWVGRACACCMYTHSSVVIWSPSVLVSQHAVVSRGHTPFNGVYLCKTTSAAAWAACLALSFVLHLFSLCSFCSAVQQHNTFCHVCFCVSFSPPLFPGSFVGHFENTMVPFWQPWSFTLRTWCNGSISTTH